MSDANNTSYVIEDLHRTIVRSVHDRSMSSMVCKRWKSLCDDELRHPLEAVLHGDVYSIMSVLRSANFERIEPGFELEPILVLLVDNGYEDEAKTLVDNYRLLKDYTHHPRPCFWRSRNPTVIMSLMDDGYRSCDVDYVGSLGPGFPAYDLMKEDIEGRIRERLEEEQSTTNQQDKVQRNDELMLTYLVHGMCRGGHVDEVKKYPHVVEAYIGSMIRRAIFSNNADMVRYVIADMNDDHVEMYEDDMLECASSSTPEIVDIVMDACRTQLYGRLLGQARNIDVFHRMYGEASGLIRHATDKTVSIILYNMMLQGDEKFSTELYGLYPGLVDDQLLRSFCFSGKLRLADRVIKERNMKCGLCQGKFHLRQASST